MRNLMPPTGLAGRVPLVLYKNIINIRENYVLQHQVLNNISEIK